jgi:hypothetical protein
MEVISDTSFLMVLCYDPVKNLDALESRFGKLLWLIHPETINELAQLEKTAGIKRSKIASLSIKIINDRIKKGDFKYLDNDEFNKLEITQANSTVDSILLNSCLALLMGVFFRLRYLITWNRLLNWLVLFLTY